MGKWPAEVLRKSQRIAKSVGQGWGGMRLKNERMIKVSWDFVDHCIAHQGPSGLHKPGERLAELVPLCRIDW